MANRLIQRRSLEAEILRLTQRLGGLPENYALERRTIKGRLTLLETEIRALVSPNDSDPALGSVALLFEGDAVGRTGIEADFAARAVRGFSAAVSSFQPEKIAGGDLQITSIVYGSFGFLLEEKALSDSLVGGPTSTAIAIDRTVACMQNAADASDLEFFRNVPRGVLGGLRNLFETLHSNRTMMKIWYEEEIRFSPVAIARAAKTLGSPNIGSKTMLITGTLTGIFADAREFEISNAMPDGKSYHGLIDSGVDILSIAKLFGVLVKAQVTVSSTSWPGRTARYHYLLTEIGQVGQMKLNL